MAVHEDPTKRAGDPAEEPQPDPSAEDEASRESFPASDPPQQSEGPAA